MNDSLLVPGILSRLDALTAKMGVAANEIWSIWLATSWRPMLEVSYSLVLSLVAVVLGGLVARRALKTENEPLFFVGVVPFVAGTVALLIALCNLPDALVYLSEPRLYALDQLRELVGK